MEDMERLFPGSKFIHIIRDYRDNIVSCRRSFGEKDLALLANRWVNYHRKIDVFDRMHSGKVLPIRYEYLAAHPQDVMKEICGFLKIPYHEQMLQFYKVDKREGSTSKAAYRLLEQIHPNLRNPVNTNAVNRWMKELKQEELELIDHIAGKYAESKGYEPTTHKSKWFYPFISAEKQIQFHTTFGLTRFYYFMPVFLRSVMLGVSIFLYKTTGYKSRLNRLRLDYPKQLEKEKKGA